MFVCTGKNEKKNGISRPNFYGNVVNKARKLKHNPLGLVNYLNNCICEGFLYNTFLTYLNHCLLWYHH